MLLNKERSCLNHYLEGAFLKLSVATRDFQEGREVDHHTMDWLLAQVDFAIEALAQEGENLDTDQRAKILQLMLGVANLNEYVRSRMAIMQHSD